VADPGGAVVGAADVEPAVVGVVVAPPGVVEGVDGAVVRGAGVVSSGIVVAGAVVAGAVVAGAVVAGAVVVGAGREVLVEARPGSTCCCVVPVVSGVAEGGRTKT
jgi:hypothetical protein